MARRSPARFLAPLALVAFAVALLMVINSGANGGDDETPAQAPSTTASPSGEDAQSGDGEPAERKRKAYIVKPGDTPSAIAEKTGVPLAQIEELNPDLDPQLLNPGDKIRLSR
jgi:LysM repeat protein